MMLQKIFFCGIISSFSSLFSLSCTQTQLLTDDCKKRAVFISTDAGEDVIVWVKKDTSKQTIEAVTRKENSAFSKPQTLFQTEHKISWLHGFQVGEEACLGWTTFTNSQDVNKNLIAMKKNSKDVWEKFLGSDKPFCFDIAIYTLQDKLNVSMLENLKSNPLFTANAEEIDVVDGSFFTKEGKTLGYVIKERTEPGILADKTIYEGYCLDNSLITKKEHIISYIGEDSKLSSLVLNEKFDAACLFQSEIKPSFFILTRTSDQWSKAFLLSEDKSFLHPTLSLDNEGNLMVGWVTYKNHVPTLFAKCMSEGEHWDNATLLATATENSPHMQLISDQLSSFIAVWDQTLAGKENCLFGASYSVKTKKWSQPTRLTPRGEFCSDFQLMLSKKNHKVLLLWRKQQQNYAKALFISELTLENF